MRRRPMISRGVVLLGFVAVLIMSGPLAAAGQAQTTSTGTSWTHPRTPWGDPDLRGIWRGYTRVPLERPPEVQGREFLTDAELAAKRKAQEALQERKRLGQSYE